MKYCNNHTSLRENFLKTQCLIFHHSRNIHTLPNQTITARTWKSSNCVICTNYTLHVPFFLLTQHTKLILYNIIPWRAFALISDLKNNHTAHVTFLHNTSSEDALSSHVFFFGSQMPHRSVLLSTYNNDCVVQSLF